MLSNSTNTKHKMAAAMDVDEEGSVAGADRSAGNRKRFEVKKARPLMLMMLYNIAYHDTDTEFTDASMPQTMLA